MALGALKRLAGGIQSRRLPPQAPPQQRYSGTSKERHSGTTHLPGALKNDFEHAQSQCGGSNPPIAETPVGRVKVPRHQHGEAEWRGFYAMIIPGKGNCPSLTLGYSIPVLGA